MSWKRSTEGEVRAVARGGDAVVATRDGIVLVPGALPGERVEWVATASKRGAKRGRLTRVLRPSSLRRAPACLEAGRCGGCPLMIADEGLQREIKLKFLREACSGLPGSDDLVVEWVPSPAVFGYRRRTRLAWHGEVMGYRKRHSKQVADIADCIVMVEPLRQIWSELRSALRSALRGDGEIRLHLGAGTRVLIELDAEQDQPPALFAACEAFAARKGVAGVTLRTTPAGHPATWGDTELVIPLESGGALRGPVTAFSQANEGVNAELVETVTELAEPQGQRVLELHCGIGNFTHALAAHADSLVAVERDPKAAQACQANLKRLGLRARVMTGDANRPPKADYDVVVLDPPRQGARVLFEADGILPGPRRMVYVSCDTATLARDLRLACAMGYRVERALGFDMFPQTAHLESVVLLVRA